MERNADVGEYLWKRASEYFSVKIFSLPAPGQWLLLESYSSNKK
jgi:hypothetical protein